MVTAVYDLKMIQRARELGALDYITKPFSLEYLENTIESKNSADSFPFLPQLRRRI